MPILFLMIQILKKTRRTQLCLQIQKVCFKNSPKIVAFGEKRLVTSHLFLFSQLFQLGISSKFVLSFLMSAFFLFVFMKLLKEFFLLLFLSCQFSHFFVCFLLKKNHRNFCFSIFSSKRKKEKKQWIFFSHFFS